MKMDDKARSSIKNLADWAKRVTAGYKDVNVCNTTTSFRDGLAFCAIVHHYRPDLINFESLSKENIFENNSLAFSTAEKQLGVPALLEANDMVTCSVPDRLSIITYLSTLHNCLENQNRVKNLKTTKRTQNNSTGPPNKIPTIGTRLLSSNRNDTCNMCHHRVFILERLIIDNKLYHTTCFRCCKCNCLLNPGTYIESDTPGGLYECAVCTPEENSNSIETQDTESLDSFDDNSGSLSNTPVKSLSPVSWEGKLKLSETVTNARSNFLHHSLTSKSPDAEVAPSFLRNGSFSKDSEKDIINDDSPDSGISVKEKVTVFESSGNSKSHTSFKLGETVTSSRFRPSIINSDLTPDNKSPSNISLLPTSPSDLQQNDTILSTEKLSEDLSPETVSDLDLEDTSNSSMKSTELQKTSAFLSDKLSCDNFPSSEVTPTPTVRRSLQPSFSKDSNLSKSIPSRQFQIGEYKSPLKSSRDIFKTNIQPLKLSIPSVTSSSSKNEITSSSPISSTESPKSGNISIPEIRSTYTRSLPRPSRHSSSLLLPDKPTNEDCSSETNLPKLSLTPVRRSSLESFKASEATKEETGTERVCPVEDKQQTNETNILKETTDAHAIKEVTDIPVPTVRQSLTKEIASLDSFTEMNTKLEDCDKEAAVTTVIIPEPKIPAPSSKKQPKAKDYPDDLNPFGDDEDQEEVEYPDDLNPFGDDDNDLPSVNTKVTVDDYDESKNPFALDDDDLDTTIIQTKVTLPRPSSSPNAFPFQQNSTFSSPTGSLRSTTKKRLAPKPPKISDIFPTDYHDSEADVSFNSLKSSPTGSRHSLHTPSPKLRKSKPPPPPPPSTMSRPPSAVDLKQTKDDNNMILKSTTVGGGETPKQLKKKKRPAPPVPIPKRKDNKKIPLKDILREMKEIEEKQRECERQGREIELLIRDKDKDEEPSIEEEEFIMQLFDLVNQKNALFRRQAELMYIKRSQRLEEQQAEVEMQIRQLMEKPEAEKTDDDKAKEDDLILELKDIVDQRSSIIDSIEMDRRRELEEDASVHEQIEIKNGDLPITAEIKVKSGGKKIKLKIKKDKDKSKDKNKDKDKKKKKVKESENDELKKGSAKKKWLSK